MTRPQANGYAPTIPSQLSAEERIRARLAFLYGQDRADEILTRIARLIKTHRQLRKRAPSGPYWSHEDTVLITYADSIQSSQCAPLQTLRDFLEQQLADAISMVHILPFFPWSSDDGFSVSDFRAVDENLGTWQDIADLSTHFDLAIDLVLNHCSRDNLWFVDYLSGESPASDYFIETDPATNVAMVTRPRTTALLSPVHTLRGLRHVWTTFSNDQVDLDYTNPNVLIEFIDILLYYIRRGARMIRLDAVAYLWKEIGTACIHLPQTHQVVKLLRDVLDVVEPAALIMTETNVPHDENISYFGDGDEAHVIYQFSLPPLILHALHSGSARYLNAWAQELEALPTRPGCTYLNFTASHDGIGLRPLEGLVPGDEIDALLDKMRDRGGYIASKSNADGTDSPYELNISYFDAFRDPRGDNRWHIPMFTVSQIIALSFKGIPAVYIHCLTATPNDTQSVERTGMTRAINRRKWDRAELERELCNAESESGRVFHVYRRLLRLRRRQAAFHPDGDQRIVAGDDRVFCFERTAPNGRQRILVLVNLSPEHVPIDMSTLSCELSGRTDLLQLSTPAIAGDTLTLAPYAAFWFSEST